MPVPEVPAILAYLRWIDRMESWNGKKFPSHLNQLTKRNMEAELYSWSTDFGNPIELPQIKKYNKAEKYRSDQLKKTMQNKKQPQSNANLHTISATSVKTPESNSAQKPLADFYKPNVWLPQPKPVLKIKSKSAPSYLRVRNNGKPTPFTIHAKQGFKYWPDDICKKKEHPTKYSFGDRYHPGRTGVVTDRIYSKPRTNYHYWAEFEQHQKPIGSGNFLLKRNRH